MRTLVLSDIHQRHVSAQHLIDTVPHDKCILLGDYFDNFGDTPDNTAATAYWLKEFVIPNPKIVALIGNHDTHYFWPYHPYFKCSGYTDWKRDAIALELTPNNTNNFEKFQFYHIDQGFLFTHAGFDNRLFKDFKRVCGTDDGSKTKLELVDEVLTYQVGRAKKQIVMNTKCELLGAGWDRGGGQHIGGINWCDFSNLSPISGVNQIVGHTPHRIPDVKIQNMGGNISVRDIVEFYDVKAFPRTKNPLSINYALDTHSNHYMVVEDGEVQIFDIHNNIKMQDIINFAIPENPMNLLS
jgi:hypothetical protein